MATFFEVQTALRNFVTSTVYPNGETNPSVAGVGIRIETGWPIPADLDTRLKAGKALVSIYQPPNMEQNTTRFFPVWETVSINDAGLTLTVSGNNITVGGDINPGEIAVVIVNKNTANPYGYTIQIGDTLNTIATALADLIPNASAISNVITVSNAFNLIGRISTQGTRARSEKSQKRVFWLIVWAPTPDIREAISDALDLAIPLNPYINLPDGSEPRPRLIYKSVADRDSLAKTSCYRRDFNVSVEYETIQTAADYTIENIHSPTSIVTSIS